MKPRQFVLRFLAVCVFLLAGIGGFNRLVDPFWYYRDFEVRGFNEVKPKFRRFERDVKPALLVREQAEAIILGSSFAEIGFDPTNPDFTRQGRLKSMNYAFAGALWSMVQCQFEFAVSHAGIKRALVGIHPEAMPKADCAKKFPSIGEVSLGELLFSSRALSASVQTVSRQKKDKASHTREGMYFYTRDKPGVDKRFIRYFELQVDGKPECLQAASQEIKEIAPLKESALDLSGLQHLIQLANQHQVELVLFVYPHHALSLELDQQCGAQAERWQAMKQIARLNERLGKGSVPIWQFYSYKGLMAEPIAERAKYWQDPEHFNFEIGNLMLADMFHEGTAKPELGRLVSSNSIDRDYQDFLSGRLEHLRARPHFQAELQKLLPRIKPK